LAQKKRNRRPGTEKSISTPYDRARDELFHAIRHCGVLSASEDEQIEWMDETLAFMAERHQELSQRDLEQLRHTGLRFCQPVIPHGAEHTAVKSEGANAA